jgi:hypothetical protein
MVGQLETATDTTKLKSLAQFALLTHAKNYERELAVHFFLLHPSHKPLPPSFLPPSWKTVAKWVPGSTLCFQCFLLRISSKEQTNTALPLPHYISISGKYSLVLALYKDDAGYQKLTGAANTRNLALIILICQTSCSSEEIWNCKTRHV